MNLCYPIILIMCSRFLSRQLRVVAADSLFGSNKTLFSVQTINGVQNAFPEDPTGPGGQGGGTFLYFSYGSNLYEKRIHVNNPSARRRGSGLVKEYRLDFHYYSERWKGAVATVVPDKEENVWGAIWEIGNEHMESLDGQEGVAKKIYEVFLPVIYTPDNQTLICRSYHLTDQPDKQEPLPESRYPSHLYHKVIVDGARESNLPQAYVDKLANIPHRAESPNAAIPLGYA